MSSAGNESRGDVARVPVLSEEGSPAEMLFADESIIVVRSPAGLAVISAIFVPVAVETHRKF